MISLRNASTIAVFDVDETLIPIKSMFSFLAFAMNAKLGKAAGEEAYALFCAEIGKNRISLPRETVNRLFYRVFKGWAFTELEKLAEQWWDQIQPQNRWIPEVVSTLKHHQKAGHPIVLLSGSADFILKPISKALAVDVTLAIRLGKMHDNLCDGEILGIQTIGQGKQEALAQLESLAEINATIVGYGDHESDLAFLRYCDEAHLIVHQNSEEPDWSRGMNILRVQGNSLVGTTRDTN